MLFLINVRRKLTTRQRVCKPVKEPTDPAMTPRSIHEVGILDDAQLQRLVGRKQRPAAPLVQLEQNRPLALVVRILEKTGPMVSQDSNSLKRDDERVFYWELNTS